jgi:adenosylcobinamide-GDP ribazoletransferase
LRGLVAALQFLTRIPLTFAGTPGADAIRASIAWFPAVGALLGVILVAVDHVALTLLARPAADATVIAVWIALSGALHLDGLVDSVDGLIAGPSTADRLAAMRESTAGTAGATAAVLTLLVAFVALGELHGPARTTALLLAPLCGRCAIVDAYWAFPYGRAEPTLSLLLKEGTASIGVPISLALGFGWALLTGGPAGGAIFALVPVIALTVGWIALRRLPGVTGDICGAICEITQLGVLLVAPFVVRP